MSDRVQVIEYKGKQILLHDYSNLKGDELMSVLRKASSMVDKRGSDLNILTDVRGVFATKEAMDELKGLAKKATPYVRKSAVVGVEGIKKVFLDAVRMVTGRQIKAFSTVEDAKEWLVS